MTMQHQIIFLNGPPGCGKDLAARFIMNEFSTRHLKFAAPIKEAMRELFSISPDDYRALETGVNSDVLKNNVRQQFGGRSWRQLLMWFSEECVKPAFGPEIFGKLAVNSLRATTGANITVFSDCGFPHEVNEVARIFGAGNCHVFVIERPDCSFEGDSRSYLNKAELETMRLDNRHLHFELIHNRHEKLMYRIQICSRVGKILGIDKDWG